MAIVKSGSSPNQAFSDDHSIIKLDLNTRSFDGPSGYSVSVAGDNNSQMLTFKTQAEFDGVPLIGTSAILTYWTSWTDDDNPPKHSKGQIDLTSSIIEISESNEIQFSWVLDNKQTYKPGYCMFMISFVLVDDENFYYDYDITTITPRLFNGVWQFEATRLDNGEREIVDVNYYSLSSSSGQFNIIDPGIGEGYNNIILDPESELVTLINQLISRTKVDQVYNPDSKFAQSGKAISGALEAYPKLDSDMTWIFDGGNSTSEISINEVIIDDIDPNGNQLVRSKGIAKYVNDIATEIEIELLEAKMAAQTAKETAQTAKETADSATTAAQSAENAAQAAYAKTELIDDYVIRQGQQSDYANEDTTKRYWLHYRIWNSKFVEIWVEKYYSSIERKTPHGSLYYSDTINLGFLPSDLGFTFKNRPSVYYSLTGLTHSSFLEIGSPDPTGGNYHLGRVYLAGSNEETTDATICIHLIGYIE